jgi:hypothetical protein
VSLLKYTFTNHTKIQYFYLVVVEEVDSQLHNGEEEVKRYYNCQPESGIGIRNILLLFGANTFTEYLMPLPNIWY